MYIDGDDGSTALAEQWLTAILSDVVAHVPQQASSLVPLD